MDARKRVKKIVMLAMLASLVTGCTALHPTGCHKTTALGSCGSGRLYDQDEWGVQGRAIKAAILAQLAEPQQWKGKRCRLHLRFSEDGTATRVFTSVGNKAYCEALKAAAEKAKFPAFTNKEVYRDFAGCRFEMRG